MKSTTPTDPALVVVNFGGRRLFNASTILFKNGLKIIPDHMGSVKYRAVSNFLFTTTMQSVSPVVFDSKIFWGVAMQRKLELQVRSTLATLL